MPRIAPRKDSRSSSSWSQTTTRSHLASLAPVDSRGTSSRSQRLRIPSPSLPRPPQAKSGNATPPPQGRRGGGRRPGSEQQQCPCRLFSQTQILFRHQRTSSNPPPGRDTRRRHPDPKTIRTSRFVHHHQHQNLPGPHHPRAWPCRELLPLRRGPSPFRSAKRAIPSGCRTCAALAPATDPARPGVWMIISIRTYPPLSISFGKHTGTSLKSII